MTFWNLQAPSTTKEITLKSWKIDFDERDGRIVVGFPFPPLLRSRARPVPLPNAAAAQDSLVDADLFSDP